MRGVDEQRCVAALAEQRRRQRRRRHQPVADAPGEGVGAHDAIVVGALDAVDREPGGCGSKARMDRLQAGDRHRGRSRITATGHRGRHLIARADGEDDRQRGDRGVQAGIAGLQVIGAQGEHGAGDPAAAQDFHSVGE